MKDGFIFAFGYGIANIALIISLLEAFRSGRGVEPSLSIPVALAKLYGITRREQEVIEKILAGKGNREIAGELYISPRTVDTHLSNIFRKCGVSSRLQLTRLISDYGKLRSS
ncbi:MAG: helix-turn-helix transcriptional regulator [Spirochaetia bacterium]|nr:helix-turn-helix transcriptional regulator [Spirochaetia bacterium]